MTMLVASEARARTPVSCAADAESAQSLRQRKKLVEAQRLLVACADAACPTFVRSDCLRWLGEVEATMPTIVVRASRDGQDAVDGFVSVDGGPGTQFGVAIALDPGPHTLRVKSSSGEGELRVLVAEGEKNRVIVVTVAPVASPAPAAPSRSEPFYRRSGNRKDHHAPDAAPGRHQGRR
jgi:hypothetical protein